MELTQGQLHVEQRQTAKDEEDAIWHQEGAAAILIANVGKPPDVAQVNGEPDHGQKELGLLAPSFTMSLRHGHDQHALKGIDGLLLQRSL